MLPLLLALTAVAGDPAAGAKLAGLAGCAACHTAEDGAPYAGGYAIVTDFGTFYGSNLTPDPDTGIGAWSEADFVRAMRHGRSPEGKAYWPAFPYPSFTQIDDDDLGDLWAYLQTLEPVVQEVAPSDVSRSRFELSLWRRLAFRRVGRAYEVESGEHALGAYLTNAVGHCGECHTPRSGIGIPRKKQVFSGTDAPPEPAPPITSEALGWSIAELSSFLEDGWTPDDDVVGGEMARIVREGTAKLTDEERRAMAAYILSR